MEETNQLSKQLFEENEKRSVKMASLVTICTGFLLTLFLMLSLFNVIDLGLTSKDYLLAISSTIIIFASLIPWIFNKHHKAFKYITFGVLLLSIGILDYLFSYFIMAFLIIPLILTTRYYNKKFTLIIFIALLMVLLTSNSLVYIWGKILGPDSPAVKDYIFNFKLDWTNYFTFSYRNYLFKVLLLLLPFVACYITASSGNKMIAKQAEITSLTVSLETDMKNASIIQQQALPINFNLAQNEGIDLYALMKPAKEVAGDFYDFFIVDENLFFMVGDVSDKGLYAAMFMMKVKNIIHALAYKCSNLEEIISLANGLICEGNESLMFVTLWMGVINIKTKKGCYINAGHPNAFIKKENGNIVTLKCEPQSFIGIFEDYKFKSYKFSLKENETIVLYTDGVTDALNTENELFGENRLINSLATDKNDSMQLCNHIYNEISDFSKNKNQFDDITILSIQINKIN